MGPYVNTRVSDVRRLRLHLQLQMPIQDMLGNQ